MNKDIESFNDKGQRHGLWEIYYFDSLRYKCFYHNGKKVGYNEYHWGNGESEKTYHL